MQKDMNFRNTIIIHHFGPENPQNPTQKDSNFEKMHSLPLQKCLQIRKVFIFPEFCTFHTTIQMHPLTSSNTNQLIIFLGTPSNTFFELCRPIVIYSDSSTLAQDAVQIVTTGQHIITINFLIFQRPISICVVF